MNAAAHIDFDRSGVHVQLMHILDLLRSKFRATGRFRCRWLPVPAAVANEGSCDEYQCGAPTKSPA